MSTGIGAGAALYEAFRRRPRYFEGTDDASSQVGAGVNPGDAIYRQGEQFDARALPDRPMGTIETLAHTLPQSQAPSGAVANLPAGDGAAIQAERPRRVLSLRPPAAVSVDPSAVPSYEGMAPDGVPTLAPPGESAGRAPRPPLRSVSDSFGRFQDERNALPSERQFIEQRRPKGVLGQIGEV